MKDTRKDGNGSAQGAAEDARIVLGPIDGVPLFRKTAILYPYPCVRRSDIQRADYNPRLMDAGAKKKLREDLKKYGLVNRLVWNQETGVLVGGHQRLEQMDKLQGYPSKCEDYLVPVDVNGLGVPDEKEVNLVLNNLNLQGTWDVKALEDLFEAGDVNPFAAGFETLDLEFMLGREETQSLRDRFLSTSESEEEEADMPAADVTQDGVGDMELVEAEAERIQSIKERRREAQAADQELDNPDHILHFVFSGPKTMREWLQANGFPVEARYIAIEKLEGLLDEAYEKGLNAAGEE